VYLECNNLYKTKAFFWAYSSRIYYFTIIFLHFLENAVLVLLEIAMHFVDHDPTHFKREVFKIILVSFFYFLFLWNGMFLFFLYQ